MCINLLGIHYCWNLKEGAGKRWQTLLKLTDKVVLLDGKRCSKISSGHIFNIWYDAEKYNLLLLSKRNASITYFGKLETAEEKKNNKTNYFNLLSYFVFCFIYFHLFVGSFVFTKKMRQHVRLIFAYKLQINLHRSFLL